MAHECIITEELGRLSSKIKAEWKCNNADIFASYQFKGNQIKKESTKVCKQHKQLEECASFIVSFVFCFGVGTNVFFPLFEYFSFTLAFIVLFIVSLRFFPYLLLFFIWRICVATLVEMIHTFFLVARRFSFASLSLCWFIFFLVRSQSTHGVANEEDIRSVDLATFFLSLSLSELFLTRYFHSF